MVGTGGITRAQAGQLIVAEAGIANIVTMIAIKERVRTDPTAPSVPAGRHEASPGASGTQVDEVHQPW
jgi:hypothetical protein